MEFSLYTTYITDDFCVCNAKHIAVLERESAISSFNMTTTYFSCSQDAMNYFQVSESIFYYFPKNLETFLKPSLKRISVNHSKLKEIHQADLKNYKDLKYLQLDGNEIQIIEKDLLKFNTKLKYFSLKHNELMHVDPNVFDELMTQTFLDVSVNPCILDKGLDPKNIQSTVNLLKEK